MTQTRGHRAARMPRAATPSEPFLLSDSGSTRASAYEPSNKSVRTGARTHATWLDAVSGVRVRSFDHTTNTWSDTVRVGDGHDNHASPCLSLAPDGRLRLAYGPHGFGGANVWNAARFKLLETERPNDCSRWRHVISTGYGATYASLVTDSQGRDHLAYRGGPTPSDCMYERRLSDRNVVDLVTKVTRMTERYDYTFFNAGLVVGPQDTLYLGFMYCCGSTGTSRGCCVLRSADGGETWAGLDGRPAKLPLAYDPAFAVPCRGENPYLHALTVDAEGSPVALTGDLGSTRAGHSLCVFRENRWDVTALNPLLPEGWLISGGTLTCDARGRLLAAVMAARRDETQGAASIWGAPSTECFLMASTDSGRSFESSQISRSSAAPNWLPNIMRIGPGADLSRPLVLYTHGLTGAGCQPAERTEVYGVWID